MSGIPVIDLSRPGSADSIARACEDIGFFCVTGHGVSESVLRASWRAARDFFDLPLAARMRVAMPYAGYPYGYSPLSGETLARSLGDAAPPDRKQSFAIGPVTKPPHTITDPDEDFAWSPNLWPDELPALQESWTARYTALSQLAARLLSLMAESLHLPDNYFDAMIDRHTSAMRALDYPGAADSSVAISDGQWGASAHTDYGTLTILETDPDQPGLQVRRSDDEWVDVDPPRGALVVNLGDAMERWTNDRWRSTLHRVTIPAGRRQSIAFFHNANWDAVIECLPTCLQAGEQARHSPIAAGPHLMSKFKSTVNRY
jgi:isopenicillin N synthase-like dioxygenase